jgi:HEAT repeat protein
LLLRDGLTAKKAGTRANAVRALGVLGGDATAQAWAQNALVDRNPDVRCAAATALGQIGTHTSIQALKDALKDPEPRVVLAAAQALYTLGDPTAFEVFIDVLGGRQHADNGFIKVQLRGLRDPKRVAVMGIEEGSGFIPFGGYAMWLLEELLKESGTPSRADAARKLSRDPESAGSDALVRGTCDKTWQVRAAAASAIAVRSDASLLGAVTPLLSDRSSTVRFSAAVAVMRLLRPTKV